MMNSIPNLAAAEGVVVHWLRIVAGERDHSDVDCIASAVEIAMGDSFSRASFSNEEVEFIVTRAFSEGAAFGVRAALAVANAPLGGAEPSIAEAVDLAAHELVSLAVEIADDHALAA